MARPQKKIDPAIVEGLAARFATITEIAAVVGCDRTTISRRFARAIAKGRERGKMTLREKQWQAVQNGNIAMMIWLGKQYLGQAERQEVSGVVGVGALSPQDILARLAAPLPPDEIEAKLESEQKLLEDTVPGLQGPSPSGESPVIDNEPTESETAHSGNGPDGGSASNEKGLE